MFMMSTQSLHGALPAYAELQCVSNFSFLRGASHPEELAERACQLGYGALALTDECSLAGVVRAHMMAKQLGLPFIVGSQFLLQPADGPAFNLIALAQNREGYGNLAELITLGRTRAQKGSYLLHADDLAAPAPSPGALAWLAGLPADPGASLCGGGRNPAAPGRLAGAAFSGARLSRLESAASGLG
jgi:DNA polymerase III alpha subunit